MYSNSKKGFESTVTITEYKGKYRLSFSRKLCRHYWGKDTQVRRTLDLVFCKANDGKAEQTAWQIHHDVLANNFDATKLWKYGLEEQPKLTVIEGIKKELSLLELYDVYCESRKGSVAETTLEIHLKGTTKNTITEAINAVGEDALAIRSWLVETHSDGAAKNCLRYLSKACQLGIKQGLKTNNPFDGMAEEINLKKSSRKTDNGSTADNEDNDTRAFSVNEMNAIIEAFEAPNKKHLAPIIKFLFWTGCRTGEAIALKWRDIKWNKEIIVFRRTYNHQLKLFKPTKTGVIRYFPLPKDSELWNLLKSLPQGDLDDVVFKSKTKTIINRHSLWKVWAGYEKKRMPGVILALIKEGLVKEYLKLYATRHTFISHQVNIHKIPITTVAQWVGNGAMVSNNSYLDRDRMTVPGHSSNTVQASDNTSDNQLTNSAMNDFVSSLTPEQIEQFKALLNK